MEGKSRENEFCRTFQKRRGREPALRKYGLRGGRNGRKPVKTADKSCQIYNTPRGIIIIDATETIPTFEACLEAVRASVFPYQAASNQCRFLSRVLRKKADVTIKQFVD
jgi:hypothetical protein